GAMTRRATGSPGRAERGGEWGAISGPPTFTDVTLQRDGRVVTITIDRPADQNRLTREVLPGPEASVHGLAGDGEAQAPVLTGRGRSRAAADARGPRAGAGDHVHGARARRRRAAAPGPRARGAPGGTAAPRGAGAGRAHRGQRPAGHTRRQAHRDHAPGRGLRRGALALGRAPIRARVEPRRGRGHARAPRGTRAALHRALSDATAQPDAWRTDRRAGGGT